MFFFCALRLTTYILVATDRVSPSHTVTCCSSLSAREPLPFTEKKAVTGTLRIGESAKMPEVCSQSLGSHPRRHPPGWRTSCCCCSI